MTARRFGSTVSRRVGVLSGKMMGKLPTQDRCCCFNRVYVGPIHQSDGGWWIARYPVTLRQLELPETATLHWTWLRGDRDYAFVKEADTLAFFWLTARDRPELVRFAARYRRLDDPIHSAVIVTVPQGTVFDVRNPTLAELLAEATKAKVRLLRLGRGCFDAMPISVLTTTMATAIEQVHGAPVASERFRANLMVWRDDPASTEPAWLGRSVAVAAEGA